MLISVQDDDVLRIYQSTEEAVRDVEALDAEETIRGVFDETGRCYAIRWIRSNQRGLFTVGNGVYTLAPDGRVDMEALRNVIRGARFVEPESLKPWLQELEGRLTSRLSGPAWRAAVKTTVGGPAAQRRSVRRSNNSPGIR